MPVGKAHFLGGENPPLPLSAHDFHLFADLADFPAVGSGIHIDPTANGAGNAMGEFQAGKAQVCRNHRRPAHGHPGHYPKPVSGKGLDSLQAVLQADHQPPNPFVRSQHIGSCAQNSKASVQ